MLLNYSRVMNYSENTRELVDLELPGKRVKLAPGESLLVSRGVALRQLKRNSSWLKRVSDELGTIEAGKKGPEAAPVLPDPIPSDEFVGIIAQACHEANREYCESIGDTSQPSWDDAPEWQKASAIDGVRHFADNPDATPEQMHEKWMQAKVADGWVYGEVKDVDAKTHPCLVPYSELPEAQKKKDEIFISTVRQMLDAATNQPALPPVETPKPEEPTIDWSPFESEPKMVEVRAKGETLGLKFRPGIPKVACIEMIRNALHPQEVA